MHCIATALPVFRVSRDKESKVDATLFPFLMDDLIAYLILDMGGGAIKIVLPGVLNMPDGHVD